MQDRGTIHSLNGLRAGSVLIVAASHCGLGYVVPGGLGVTVFFFLSGFLITRLLTDEYGRDGRISLRAFYLKRLFRLTPPLLALLALSSALVLIGALPGRITFGGLMAESLYLTNYYSLFWDTGNTTAAGTAILWSLAVEEHFYAIYPIALIFLLRRYSKRTIFRIVATVCVAILVWRMILVEAPGFNPDRIHYSTDTRIDSILYGCLLAIGWRPESESGKRGAEPSGTGRLLFAAGLLMLCLSVVVRSPYFRETFRYSLQGLALLPVFHAILCTNGGLLHRCLNHPVVARLGEYSYSFYLVHFVVSIEVARYTPLGKNPVVLFLADVAVSWMLAAAMHRFIERPSLRLRQRALAPSSVAERPAVDGLPVHTVQ